jgi:hypothetical protein
MPDTAGAGDTPVVGVGPGRLPGRADVGRDRRGAATGGAALTGTRETGPATPGREDRER